ncbi:cortical protein marker for cell polarity-domain-containing protein [Lactarius akahatsu]|uniref:Cortical protein marker for cell polarity-domain-containing protein n=1 Tax=Lactarius akahatsu TaxID=416441 RepID=A0AAD4QA33_9AGAM|nr:cortical protein marker for cell polarity-domain-containing protein [Lactarius akahatsu]
MTITLRRPPWSLLPLFALILLDVVSADTPLIDFDRMGTVGLVGAFAGLELFNSSSSSVSFDPSTSTVLSRSPDGSLTRIASTNKGGTVSAGCAIGSTYYIAGNFSSIDNTAAPNVASYDASSHTFSALGTGGPNGPANALFCDSTHNKLWVGGQFTSPASAVAVWDVKASSWSAPPFGGLVGSAAEVFSITTNSSQASLFFAGSFVATFQGSASALNTTNNPNVPFSQGATPFSSSLVPIPLESAQIQGSPSTSDPSFSNIQNILCPSGNDGPGQTWFAEDGNGAQITARTFQWISANGVRLGNTFLDGRGTTAFTVTSIPDNTVQQLHFVDPATGQNQTCTTNCPLSTNSGIPYQDFTFNNAVSLTGVQVTLSAWQGAGPGLHIFQLLSSGAFASAIGSQNGVSCFAPAPSNTSFTDTWTELDANTNIPGTTQSILVSTVDVGTSPANGPSFTWMPYVSASGRYDVNLLVPGCTDFQDCALRTSVEVTVFPGGGQAPTVTTISQQNQNDAVQPIYSGPVVPSSPDFVTTITMTLADKPAGNGQNGKYRLVADRVQLILTSANTTGTVVNGTGTAAGGRSAFGFLEWPFSLSSNVSVATGLPNTTETFLDTVGFSLFNGLGGNTSISAASVAAVAHHPSGAIFIGGTFNLGTPSTSNIVVFKNGALTALSGRGLNGPVTSLVLDGDTLFVGGSFTDTPANSTQGRLSGVASYDVAHDQWSPLLAGVNGPVKSLGIENDQLAIAGNFSILRNAPGSNTGLESSGLALWNVTGRGWVNNGGFLVGSLTFIGNGTTPAKGQQQSQIIAGNIANSLTYGASGFVLLKNGDNGQPAVTPLTVQLDSDVVTTSVATNARRRNNYRRSAGSWFSRHVKIRQLFKRQSSTSLAPLPASPPAPAPAVLAGTFWTNTTSTEQVAIIGGNFTFTDGNTSSAGLAVYNPSTGALTALQGQTINGTVRTLLVQDTQLFVGGEFTITGTDVAGFAIYDLVHNSWVSSGVQALQGTSGASVVVRSLSASAAKTNTIIVAGSFAQAGSLPCRAICAWDVREQQWNALGSGIQGDIASVAYAGSNQDVLVAGGSITISGSSSDNVLQFTFNNASWSTLGDGANLPGPVTAITVNDGNSSSIFAAGRSVDGSSSYLVTWNGHVWTSQGSAFGGSSVVSQLTMVPLQNEHQARGAIEGDRMLLMSGNLVDTSFGQASSVLFDGQDFIPYIDSSTSSGDPGTVSGLFNSLANFSFAHRKFLATGVVILISIAIAAGIVFLLVLLGIFWTLFSRRDEVLSKFDPADIGEDDDSAQHRPSSLLAHINAATRTTILGTQSPFHNVGTEKEHPTTADADASNTGHDPLLGPDASNYLRAETPSEAFVGALASEEAGPGRLTHARYSFDGKGEGELPLTIGQELEILDDRDHSWWYARDTRAGNEGVVPAAYVY